MPRQVFARCIAMLKPGGTLGVVEHRLPESADDARELTSGYIKVSTVRRLAEAAGFQLRRRRARSTPIRRTPADHPDGVWTLPPTL